MIEFPFAIIIV